MSIAQSSIPGRRAWWIDILGAAAGYALLAVFVTWPLARHPGTTAVGMWGDGYYFIWIVDWFMEVLSGLHPEPFFAPLLNYPEGWYLAYNEMAPAMALLAMPAAVLAGPVAGYNAAILASFVLSGAGVFAWVRSLTGNRYAAFAAGCVFAFAPYRLAHLWGHFNLMGTPWFAPFFMTLTLLVTRPGKVGLRPVLAAACWAGLIAWTSVYYLYMTGVVAAVYVLALWWASRRQTAPSPGALGLRLLGVAGVAALLILPAVWPYIRLALQGGIPPRSPDDIHFWCASPFDFLVPAASHPLWGHWVESIFRRGSVWGERTLYVGLVGLTLAGIGVVRGWRNAEVAVGVRAWLAAAMGAAVLALGTHLHLFGYPVTLPLPDWLASLMDTGHGSIPLPGNLLVKWVPGYDRMRVWMRYGVFVSLFASLLAGVGAAWLLRHKGRAASWCLAAALVALIMADVTIGRPPMTRVAAREVDVWLAGQPGSGAVIQFPFDESGWPQQAYYASVHGKPFIGGFAGAYATPQYQRLAPVMEAFPDERSVGRLRELGVRWVLVRPARYPEPPTLDDRLARYGLRPAGRFGDLAVYSLAGAVAAEPEGGAP